ncbi:T9SS type A sorting domain-containing protein [Candidatus Fermentibacteria bacterium]|nr:T9SS type A sorting domain-containing protein [Candidatus Fermentibacteria bacterium]
MARGDFFDSYNDEDERGVYKSTDGGLTWTLVGMDGLRPRALALDPNDDGILFAGLASADGGGVYRSTDGGANWTLVVGSGEIITSIDVSANGEVVYATGYFGDIFVSQDGGDTWNEYGNAIPGYAFDLTTHPDSGNVAFVAEYKTDAWDDGGVWKTTDHGQSWSLLEQLGDGFSIEVDPSDPSILYSVCRDREFASPLFHLHRSTDCGSNWTQIATFGNNGFNPMCQGLAIAGDGTAFAGIAHGGVWRYDGSEAVNRSNGIYTSEVTAISVSAVDPDVFYAGVNQNGIWKTTDGGKTWEQMAAYLPKPSGQGPDYNIESLAASPTSLDTVLAGGGNSGLFISDDGGETWSITEIASYSEPHDIEIDPENPQNMYAAVFNASDMMGIWSSSDGGDNWSRDIYGYGCEMDVDPQTTSTVYACLAGMSPAWAEIYRTQNSGSTWQQMCIFPNTAEYFYDMVVSPENTDVIYTTGAGVHRSQDCGTTWTLNLGSLGLGCYSLVPNGDTLYTCTSHGVYVSTNGGSSWSTINQGLEITGTQTLSPSISEDFSSALYCGTGGRGMARSVSSTVSDSALIIAYLGPDTMAAWDTASVHISVANVGTSTWPGSGMVNPYRLGAGTVSAGNPHDNEFLWTNFANGGYSNHETDQRAYLPDTVISGQTTGLDFSIIAPGQTGTRWLEARMVHEGASWFGEYLSVPIEVTEPQGTGDTHGRALCPALIIQNPLRSGSAIRYELPTSCRVHLEIYDLTGRLLLTAVDGHVPEGSHLVGLPRSRMARGVYFARLRARGEDLVRKFVLLD